jgi:hypothetical protein
MMMNQDPRVTLKTDQFREIAQKIQPLPANVAPSQLFQKRMSRMLRTLDPKAFELYRAA